MKRPFFRLIFACVPLLALGLACGSSEEGTFSGGRVEVRFKGQVGDEEFACGQMYDGLGQNGMMAAGQDLRFYVSDVRLLTERGDEVPLEIEERSPWQAPGVALLDFEDGTGPCETSGNAAENDRVSGTAPAGAYVGLTFSVSVPEELNHEDPTTAPAPLQVTAMQWNWLLGYKFLRAEVKPMTDHDTGSGGASGHAGHLGGSTAQGGLGGHPSSAPPGTDAPMHALDSQFHLGSLGCANSGGDAMAPPAGTCKKPNRNRVTFERFNPTSQVIVVDLKEMMTDIDLSVANHCHGGPHESCVDFYETVGLDYESGQQKDGQTAFRVEDR